MTMAWRTTILLALLAGATAGASASEAIPAEYELLETIVVPPDGTTASSLTTLKDGVKYWLRASGTDPGAGDAEYDLLGQDHCGPGLPGSDVGVTVSPGFSPSGPSTGSITDKLPFWGVPDPDNVYAVPMTGRGGSAFVKYSDCDYADNFGGVTLEIFGPKPFLRPRCEVLFTRVTFHTGQSVVPRVIGLRNSNPQPVAIELKMWLRVPGYSPLAFVNVGADSSVELPGVYDEQYENVPLFTVTADFPRGSYEFGCTVADPATGEVIDRSVDRFSVR